MSHQTSYPGPPSVQLTRQGESLSNGSSSFLHFDFSRLFSEYPSSFLTVILLISLGVRLLALFSWNDSLYGDFLVWDERIYQRWASALAEGSSEIPVVLDFTPLYAYVMALVYKAFSIEVQYIRILNIVFGVATCLLVYLIGKGLAGRMVGFLACLIASLYKPFIFFSVVLMKTALSLFLFALVFYLFISSLNRMSLMRILLLGGVAGLLLNVRANAIFMIPVMPATLLVVHRKRGTSLKALASILVVYAAGVSISVLPFVARNYQVSGDLAVTASGGFNFYMGYQPDHPGPYYRPVPFASSSTAGQARQFVIEASRRMNRKLSVREASLYWIRETLRWSMDNPSRFIEKTMLKTLAVFNGFEAAENYHIGFISDFVDAFKWPLFEIWMLLPFGLAGIAVNARTSEKYSALYAVLASYAVTLVIIFTNVRIRLPLMIILIPFAVIGANTFADSLRCGNAKSMVGYALTLILFSMATVWPIEDSDDLTAHYNTHAINLYSAGHRTEAMDYWKMSSGMNGAYSPFAHLALSDHYFRSGDLKKALDRLDRIPDGSLAAAQKYAKMGDILMRQKNARAAIQAYETSLAINSGQEKVIGKLAGIYRRVDTEMALRTERKMAYIASF